LEQASASEQIQISGVHVVGILKALARFAELSPSVAKGRQTILIERDRTLGERLRAKDARVIRRQQHEREKRNAQPPGRAGMPSKRHPGHGNNRGENCQAKIANE
jgi:hypothetical protein